MTKEDTRVQKRTKEAKRGQKRTTEDSKDRGGQKRRNDDK